MASVINNGYKMYVDVMFPCRVKYSEGRMEYLKRDCEIEADRQLNNINIGDDPKSREQLLSLFERAIQEENYFAFKRLLEKSLKTPVLNENGQTAIHLIFYSTSTSFFNRDLITWMEDNFCSINYTDSNNLSLLHIACYIGSYKLAEIFSKNSADVNAHYNYSCDHFRNGFTPLHFSVQSRNRRSRYLMIHILSKHGADFNSVDSQGRTALHLECQIFEKPSEFSLENWDVLKILIQKGSNVNAKDNHNNTPILTVFQTQDHSDGVFDKNSMSYKLGIRSTKSRKQKFDFLLEQGADVTVCNKYNDTILHCIIKNFRCLHQLSWRPATLFDGIMHTKIVERVLTSGQAVDINARNNNGRSPLQLAVSFMSADIVKLLLDHGVELMDLECDEYFFSYPKIMPNLEVVQSLTSIVELLLDHGFKLNLKDNLIVLKFLLHDVHDCNCESDNVFHYGPSKHMKKLEEGLPNFRTCIEISNVQVDKRVKKTVQKLLKRKRSSNKAAIKRESAQLKTIKWNNVSLHDLMTKHPRNIVKYVSNQKFDRNLLKELNCHERIVEGHIIQALVTKYLQNSAFDYFNLLYELPEICCRKIMSYLDNYEILNMCIAVCTGDTPN